MQSSIRFRPCPPACGAGNAFPIIYVQDDFWSLNKLKKLMILQNIYYNRADVQADLLGCIETLEAGNDLVQGV